MKQTKKRLFSYLRNMQHKLPKVPIYVRGYVSSAMMPSGQVANHYKRMKRAYRSGGRQAVNEYIVKYKPELGYLMKKA